MKTFPWASIARPAGGRALPRSRLHGPLHSLEYHRCEKFRPDLSRRIAVDAVRYAVGDVDPSLSADRKAAHRRRYVLAALDSRVTHVNDESHREVRFDCPDLEPPAMVRM